MEFIFRNGTIAKQKKKAEMYYNWANDNDTDRYQFMWKKVFCMHVSWRQNCIPNQYQSEW